MKIGFLVTWTSIFTNPFYFIRKRIYTSLQKLSKEVNGNLLDFGCGSKPYLQFFSHCDSYTGLDIENPGHLHLDEHVDVYYDGKQIPFPENHFDTVFASEVFEHVFNLEEALSEIRRVLKPGGRLLFTCPFVWPEHEVPNDFARYTSFGIASLVNRQGFRILQQEKTGNFFEVIIQQIQLYIFFFLLKKPKFLYYILHQLFILPLTLFGLLLNGILPRIFKRKDLYHNNVLLVEKTV
jgi:SAM-dependent methyltransferase